MNIGNLLHKKIIIGGITAVILISLVLTAVSNNRSTAFAQSDTSTPTANAYPAQPTEPAEPTGLTSGNSESDYPVDGEEDEAIFSIQDYPADGKPTSTTETPTPYPPTIENTTDNQGNGSGSNVIGSNAADSSGSSVNSKANNNTVYLWSGFVVTLLIFIASLIGSAVLFIRKLK